MNGIETFHVYPPIPARTSDWQATFSGSPEGPVGHGATEQEAIDDLLEGRDWPAIHDPKENQ